MQLKIGAQEIFYRITGQGYPLIFLHGWGTDSSSFASIAEVLAKDFCVYAPDLPGFGLSPAPDTIFGSDEYAVLIKEFITLLKLKDPIIIGHSFGGKVALCLAAKGVGKKHILCGSVGIPPKRGINYYMRVYAYKFAKRLFSLPGLKIFCGRILAVWQKKTASTDYQASKGIMKSIFIKVVNEDMRPIMPGISTPVLLVWGENDTATPLSDGKQMEKLIPGSGLAVLRGAGHYCFLDSARQFLLIINSFLQEEKHAARQ